MRIDPEHKDGDKRNGRLDGSLPRQLCDPLSCEALSLDWNVTAEPKTAVA